MMNHKIFSSYLYFAICLIILTCVFNLIGLILPTIINKLIFVPILIAFYLMGIRYVKKFNSVPAKNERWHLSAGCTTIVWLYVILAGLVLMMFQQKTLTPDFSNLWAALQIKMLLILFFGTFLFINSILTVLGYWFLGKPLQKMLNYYQQKNQ